MSEISIVFAAEFVRRLRSRPFIIATVLGAAFVVLLTQAPPLLESFASQSDAIVLAGPAALRVPAQELLADDYHITASLDSVPIPVTTAFLNAHGKANAALVLSTRAQRLHVDVYAGDLATWGNATFRMLSPLSVHVATGQRLNLTRSYVVVDRTVHGLDAKFKDTSTAMLAHGVAIGLVTILYLAILMAAQSVVSAVAEEKTSRIAEILVATISPVNLLTGKTLAAVTLALLQVAVWLGTAALLVPGALARMTSGGPAPSAPASVSVEPLTLLAFLGFFLVGFLQFATIYAALASLISRTEDLGSVSGPVVLPAIAGFLIAEFALVSPNAPFVVAASFIPFVSAFVMFTRIALETVPAWQIVTSLLINAVAAVLCFYVAGKIYRVGMLLYGKLPSLRQIVAVLRT